MNITMAMVLEGLSEDYLCEKGDFFDPYRRVDWACLADDGRFRRRGEDVCFVVEGLHHSSLAGVPYENIVVMLNPGDSSVPCAIKVVSSSEASELRGAINDIFARYETWASNLMDLNLHGAGLEELVDFAHGLFGNPVTIVDENYRLWAQTHDDVMEDGLWVSDGESEGGPSAYLRGPGPSEKGFADYLSGLKSRGLLVDFETNLGTRLAACAIAGGSGSIMGVNVVEKNRAITCGDIECLKYFADVVSVKLKAMEFSWRDSSSSYYALLQDVVRGNLLDNSEVKARLSKYWIDLERSFTVFVITGRLRFLKYHQLCRIEDELAGVFSQGTSVISARSIVVFVNHGSDLDGALFNDLEEYARENDLAVGVSESRSDDCSLRVLLEQAQFALRARRRIAPEAYVAEYDRYRGYYLFDVCSRQADWRRYVHEGIWALCALDLDGDSSVMDTLRCLVYNHGNRTVAANELGIQRNALKYRIKKIEKLCSVDLSDQDVFDHIAFSVRLMDYCAGSEGGVQ